MLRITVEETPTEQKWALHGRLSGAWVAQLAACWKDTETARTGRSCMVDVTNLMSVDESGENVLRTMMIEGAKFHACGVYIRHVLRCLREECHSRG